MHDQGTIYPLPPQTKKSRPAPGSKLRDLMVSSRMPRELIDAIDAWCRENKVWSRFDGISGR